MSIIERSKVAIIMDSLGGVYCKAENNSNLTSSIFQVLFAPKNDINCMISFNFQEYYQLLSANSEMQSKLKVLESEKQRLKDIYEAHLATCTVHLVNTANCK